MQGAVPNLKQPHEEERELYYEKDIRSHSSFLTNKWVAFIITIINDTALIASRTKHFDDIREYFNSCEQLYINIADVIDEKYLERVEKGVAMYHNLEMAMTLNPKCRTYMNIMKLLLYVKAMNRLLISALQRYKYFFRVHTERKRGLKYADLYYTGVFGDITKRKPQIGRERNVRLGFLGQEEATKY